MAVEDADKTGGADIPRKVSDSEALEGVHPMLGKRRGIYYKGTEENPKLYCVYKCTDTPPHLRPRGKEPSEGCGRLNVVYTAKVHGHRDWQAVCPHCGKKPRLNRGRIIASFPKRKHALAYIEVREVRQEWARLNRVYFNGMNPMDLQNIIDFTHKHQDYDYHEDDYQ